MKQQLEGKRVVLAGVALTLLLITMLIPASAVNYTFEDTFDSDASLDNWTTYAVDWSPDNTSLISSPLEDTWKIEDGKLVTDAGQNEHIFREHTSPEGVWQFDVELDNGLGGVVFSLVNSSEGIPRWDQLSSDNLDEGEKSFDINFRPNSIRLDHHGVENGEGRSISDRFTETVAWENGMINQPHTIGIIIVGTTLEIYLDSLEVLTHEFTRDYSTVTAFTIWKWAAGTLSLDNIRVTDDIEGGRDAITDDISEPGFIYWMVGVGVLAIVILTYRFYFSKKKSFRTIINYLNPFKSINQSLEELFAHQEILYSLILGQSGKQIDSKLLDLVPKGLFDYKYLMHPVRLGIMKLLYTYDRLTSVEIRNRLDISWKDYGTHMKSLESNNYITVKDEFENGLKRQIVYLEFHGKQEFEEIMQLLTKFIERSAEIEDLVSQDDTLLYPHK